MLLAVVRIAVGGVSLARAYGAVWFLIGTAAALAGAGRVLTLALGLPDALAALVPLAVLGLAVVRTLPPQPWTEPWPAVVFVTTPPAATTLLLRWARGYLIVVCSLGALLALLMLLMVILWAGFGIRWGW